jgi:hypothetical protein
VEVVVKTSPSASGGDRRSMSLFIYPFFYAFSQLNEYGRNALFSVSSVAQDFVPWLRIVNVPKKETWRELSLVSVVGCGGMPLFLFSSVDQDFVRWIRVLNVPKKETWRALK